MMWPGCDFIYGGRATTFKQHFDTAMPAKTRVDTALEWFVHDKTPASLVMLYIEELDELGHVYGTENTVVRYTYPEPFHIVQPELNSLNGLYIVAPFRLLH